MCRSTSRASRGDDLEAIDKAGLDRKAIAARGVDAMLKMILVDGFFQANPHPGNLMCLPDNRIALIDFGMVGRLSSARGLLRETLNGSRAEQLTVIRQALREDC
jgi:predicted unusual protein kinase regulating ubiquinone biosynthesis (AarF/ABC1/UbiB family)